MSARTRYAGHVRRKPDKAWVRCGGLTWSLPGAPEGYVRVKVNEESGPGGLRGAGGCPPGGLGAVLPGRHVPGGGRPPVRATGAGVGPHARLETWAPCGGGKSRPPAVCTRETLDAEVAVPQQNPQGACLPTVPRTRRLWHHDGKGLATEAPRTSPDPAATGGGARCLAGSHRTLGGRGPEDPRLGPETTGRGRGDARPSEAPNLRLRARSDLPPAIEMSPPRYTPLVTLLKSPLGIPHVSPVSPLCMTDGVTLDKNQNQLTQYSLACSTPQDSQAVHLRSSRNALPEGQRERRYHPVRYSSDGKDRRARERQLPDPPRRILGFPRSREERLTQWFYARPHYRGHIYALEGLATRSPRVSASPPDSKT